MPVPRIDDSEELADLIEEETDIDWSKARNQLSELTTEGLLALMSELGLYVNRRLALEIADRRDAVFQLRRLLQDGANWSDSDTTSWWAPIHSIHILSLIKGPEALRLLLEVVRFRAEDLGDYITDDVAALLYSFGPEAFEALKEFTLDETLPAFARAAALSAMVARAMKDFTFRAGAVEHLRALLRDTKDTLFATLLADDLIGLDRSTLPEVLAAYRKGRIDPTFNPEDEIMELAAGGFDDVTQMELEMDTKDPLDHFTRKNILHLREVQRSWDGADEEDDEEELLDELADGEPALEDSEGGEGLTKEGAGKEGAGKNGPSKNAPCPCGSGKKYKRCCMTKPTR